MKILYLITKSEAGGAQTHVADLCFYFKNKGYDVLVVSDGGGWLEDECKNIGVKFVANKYFSNGLSIFNIIRAIKSVRGIINDFSPDIVHCHSTAAGVFTRLAIKGKIKTVYTVHGWGFNIVSNPFLFFSILLAEKYLAKYTDKYICVSESVKRIGLKYYLAKEDKFCVIYNGVSDELIKGGEMKDGEMPDRNNLRIIFVGRLASPKRPELVIRAISLLKEGKKSCLKFIIVGDGPNRNDLEKLALKKNVDVVFKGFLPRNEVFSEIKLSDFSVLISGCEGFPYSILESMSYGVPVIASDVGGNSEAINSDNGILVGNNVKEIASAIEKMMDDNTRKIYGENALKTIRSKFLLDKMLRSVDDLYNSFLL